MSCCLSTKKIERKRNDMKKYYTRKLLKDGFADSG